jgi:hypothetical protein
LLSRYRDGLEAELQGAPEPESLSLDDKWKRMETALRKVAENNIGYTRKQAVNEWFDEECEVVNEEKNALKAIDTQRHTRTAYNNYKKSRTRERYLFRRKKR